MRPVTVTFDDQLCSSSQELSGRTDFPVEELTREFVGEGVRSRARDALRGVADATAIPWMMTLP